MTIRGCSASDESVGAWLGLKRADETGRPIREGVPMSHAFLLASLIAACVIPLVTAAAAHPLDVDQRSLAEVGGNCSCSRIRAGGRAGYAALFDPALWVSRSDPCRVALLL